MWVVTREDRSFLNSKLLLGAKPDVGDCFILESSAVRLLDLQIF